MGGILKTAGLGTDILDRRIAIVEGEQETMEFLASFVHTPPKQEIVDILFCRGCINGVEIDSDLSHLEKQHKILELVGESRHLNPSSLPQIDLDRTFTDRKRRLPKPTDDQITDILRSFGKFTPEDELNCGACGYPTCCEHAIAIHQGLAESEMCLPWTIDRLRTTVGELHESHRQLASTQDALVHAEKLASMGQLAAGIAHEVNNPLGVVLMYAHLLADEAGRDSQLQADLKLIAEQADRCKRIVSGLLNFARQNQVNLQPVNVRDLVDAAMRGVRRPDNVKVRVEHGTVDPVAELDRDQVLQVLTNVMVNALEAMPNGGTLTVRTGGNDERVVFDVIDTGTGIRPEHMGKIFTPFFTTKPMGRGTGLGLAVSYGIVKMHRGEITATSNADPAAGPTGTTFEIAIPRRGRAE
jgi:nitrogen-specific signal transduction histidine kinase